MLYPPNPRKRQYDCREVEFSDREWILLLWMFSLTRRYMALWSDCLESKYNSSPYPSYRLVRAFIIEV